MRLKERKNMAKKARLEIRIDETDKEYLRKVAKLEGCSLTSLIEEYIKELVAKRIVQRADTLSRPILTTDDLKDIDQSPTYAER